MVVPGVLSSCTLEAEEAEEDPRSWGPSLSLTTGATSHRANLTPLQQPPGLAHVQVLVVAAPFCTLSSIQLRCRRQSLMFSKRSVTSRK